MPFKEKTELRRYYTIGQVASKIKVNTSTLRYWEEEFGELCTKRSHKGNRLYAERELIHIKHINHLLHIELYTIAGAKRQLEL